MLLMWLGEQITDRGIGNGISLIITIGILARLPQAGRGLVEMFLAKRRREPRTFSHLHRPDRAVYAVVAGVIAVTQAQRKIPVQYAQRVVGRKMYQGGRSFMPLQVNYSGVMPIIFASVHLDVSGADLHVLDKSAAFLQALFKAGDALTRRLFALPDVLRVDDPVLLVFLGRHAVQ